MRIRAFAGRNLKELLRDPLSLVFGVGLPAFLLVLINIINRSVPVPGGIEIFNLNAFAPGIAVFSFAFISMFSAMLVSKDRSTSFLARLFASPMSAADYMAGYSLPLLPLALAQAIICFAIACILGLSLSWGLLLALVMLIPTALLFIALGLLIGSSFADKQVGVISSILIQVAALSSGMWFPLDVIGGGLKVICYVLPFAHSVNLVESALSGDFTDVRLHLAIVLAYTAAAAVLAAIVFKRRMKN